MIHGSIPFTCLMLVYAWPCLAATRGHVDTFPDTNTDGWGGGSTISNPGTGGVGGVSDGYLRVANTVASNFGTRSGSADYEGDFTAAGITQVTFYLNDVGPDESFSIRLLITDNSGTTWQHNVGLDPPNGSWQQYTVDLTTAANWSRTTGTSTFAQTVQDVARVHFRHDLPPYTSSPDPRAGTLGIDNIVLGPDCEEGGTPDPVHPDADGDRIIDGCDQCPNTITGSPIDASGCPPLIPGDYDRDGDVDADDLMRFLDCDLGPNIPQTDPACANMLHDADSDVDSDDFGVWQRCFGGAGMPGNPACSS